MGFDVLDAPKNETAFILTYGESQNKEKDHIIIRLVDGEKAIRMEMLTNGKIEGTDIVVPSKTQFAIIAEEAVQMTEILFQFAKEVKKR